MSPRLSGNELKLLGPDMPSVQCLESRSRPTSTKSGFRVGPIWYSSQHNIAGLYCDSDGGGAFQAISRAEKGLADTEHAREVERAKGVSRSCGVFAQ